MKRRLEGLYCQYNHRAFVHPDPLEFLYDYQDLCDREIVGFVASSLAYGRVAQILKSISCVLKRMGPSPHCFLKRASQKTIFQTFSDFRHRFTDGRQLSAMLLGLKETINTYGSLNACFVARLKHEDDSILEALTGFTDVLSHASGNPLGHLVPSPRKGSACKRLHLFLRWMVRKDDVDPGGWHNVPTAKLIVPVDTHIHRLCRCMGLTDRKQANRATAIEITDCFKTVSPKDPVKYDFSLTRLGIRKDADAETFLRG
jgi:uncharacterized protein (TIGR02757 family)